MASAEGLSPPTSEGGTVAPSSESWRNPGTISAALTILGVVVYGWSYFLALLFYGAFDVTPEDVGWSQVRGITRAALAIAGLLLLGTIAGAVIGTPVGYVFGWVFRSILRLLRRRVTRWPSRPAWLTGLQRVANVALVLIVVAYLAFVSINSLRISTERIKAVSDENPNSLALVMAGVSAPVGEATWADQAASSGARTSRSLVSLLGQANGTTIFFDGCTREILRVPTDAFSLRQVVVDGDEDGDVDGQALLRSYCAEVGRPVDSDVRS